VIKGRMTTRGNIPDLTVNAHAGLFIQLLRPETALTARLPTLS
jgi:hypothetical protein